MSGSPLLWWDGFAVGLLLTCLIELPAYVFAFVTLGWCRLRASPLWPLTMRSALGLALAINLITHPMFWAVARRLDGPAELLAAELGVAVLEGLLIFAVVQARRGEDSRSSRLRWSLLTAVGVNTLSLLVGLVVLPLLI